MNEDILYSNNSNDCTFFVYDIYDVARCPSILIEYNTNLNVYDFITYKMYIWFNGDNYKFVNKYELYLNKKFFFKKENCDLILSDFLNINDKNDILPGSEDKFLIILNKILALVAFM